MDEKQKTKDKLVSKIKEVKEIVTRRIVPAVVKIPQEIISILKSIKFYVDFIYYSYKTQVHPPAVKFFKAIVSFFELVKNKLKSKKTDSEAPIVSEQSAVCYIKKK